MVLNGGITEFAFFAKYITTVFEDSFFVQLKNVKLV